MRKKEVKYDTRQPAVGWGRRRVVGHAREVLPDIDAFHLGVEPFCKQRRGVNYSCQVQSHLFMCSLFQFFSKGDRWASAYVSGRR